MWIHPGPSGREIQIPACPGISLLLCLEISSRGILTSHRVLVCSFIPQKIPALYLEWVHFSGFALAVRGWKCCPGHRGALGSRARVLHLLQPRCQAQQNPRTARKKAKKKRLEKEKLGIRARAEGVSWGWSRQMCWAGSHLSGNIPEVPPAHPRARERFLEETWCPCLEFRRKRRDRLTAGRRRRRIFLLNRF